MSRSVLPCNLLSPVSCFVIITLSGFTIPPLSSLNAEFHLLVVAAVYDDVLSAEPISVFHCSLHFFFHISDRRCPVLTLLHHRHWPRETSTSFQALGRCARGTALAFRVPVPPCSAVRDYFAIEPACGALGVQFYVAVGSCTVKVRGGGLALVRKRSAVQHRRVDDQSLLLMLTVVRRLAICPRTSHQPPRLLRTQSVQTFKKASRRLPQTWTGVHFL